MINQITSFTDQGSKRNPASSSTRPVFGYINAIPAYFASQYIGVNPHKLTAPKHSVHNEILAVSYV